MRRLGWVMGMGMVLATASFGWARSLATFGMCLEREGAVFYGASWCPHCDAQRTMLGSGMRYVRYVECSVDGGREKTQECQDAGITKFPTWVFGDGSQQTGRLSLEKLAAGSGCSLDEGDEDSSE